MKKLITILSLTFIVGLIQSCKSVDLRSEALRGNTIESSEEKGRKLLNEAKIAMGYDKLAATEVYEANVYFDWKTIWQVMPMNAFPRNNNKNLQMKLATNSFDGQIEYKEGLKKGKIQGLQSWRGYKNHVDSKILKDSNKKKYQWGLATYHYLIEAPMHLPDAGIVHYAGTKLIDGITYETVYVTWGTPEPNKEFDRFLAYIHPTTKFIDLLEVTINDFFLPMPKGMQHATARYDRSETSSGAFLPSNITIQLLGPKKIENKVYSLALKNYQFDSFDKKDLYPIEGLEYMGTSKERNE